MCRLSSAGSLALWQSSIRTAAVAAPPSFAWALANLGNIQYRRRIQRSSVHHFPSVMLSVVLYNYYYLSTCLSAVDHDQFNWWWWWWWRWWSQPWSFFEVNTKLLSLHFHPLVVFSSPFPSVCLLLWTESVFCCHFWLPLFPWRWCLRLSLPSSSLFFFALKDDLLGLSLAAKAAAVETNGNEQV